MPTVVIEPDLYQRVEQAASQHHESVPKLLADAVQYYLWELDRQKISYESRIYRQRHEELKKDYLGFYVALHDGEVVDRDEDFDVLFRRTRERFGRIPIMITKVGASAENVSTRRGIRIGNLPV